MARDVPGPLVPLEQLGLGGQHPRELVGAAAAVGEAAQQQQSAAAQRQYRQAAVDGRGERVLERVVAGERRQLFLVQEAGDEEAGRGRRQRRVAADVQGLEREAHGLEQVDGVERERLERRPPGDREREAGGGRKRREQPARPRRQVAAARGRRRQTLAVQERAGLAAERGLSPLDRLGTDLTQAALAAAVLARELLAELRRQPAEHRQPGGLLEDAAQVRGGALVVATDDDGAGELDGAGQYARAAGGRGGGRTALAGVDDEHQRGVQRHGDVHRTRALDAFPAIQRRLHRHDHGEVRVGGPGLVELAGHGVADEARVEDARRARGGAVQQAPQRQLGAEKDGADGALVGERGEQRAGGERHGGSGLEPAHDQTRGGHGERPPFGLAAVAAGELVEGGIPGARARIPYQRFGG